MPYSAQELMHLLSLRPHPEGGWFAVGERSGISIPVPGFPGKRDTCSCIYYLLQKGEISRWHRLRASEIWTWHQGGSLLMTLGGGGAAPEAGRTMLLGPRLEAGEPFRLLAPAGQWQTTRVVDGDFALVSCVVCPAYHDEDCLLPEQPLPNEIYS